MRADIYLVSKNYVKSRQKAKNLIDGGFVKINSLIVEKPSLEIDENAVITVEIADPCPYVSRGGLKLEEAIKTFNIDVSDKIALDIGASTGGFTDCLIKHGAKKVFAVDSGEGQLDISLQSDERVISYEHFNARNITKDDIGCEVDVITVDVSFISQTYILAPCNQILSENGVYIGLIKPQFEAGKENIGKGGIVKSKEARLLSVYKVIDCASDLSLVCTGLIKSPILGGDGNTEYLAVFEKHGIPISKDAIKKTVLKTKGET